MKPTIEAAVALIARDGQYLVSLRKLEDPYGGYWEFPGGTRESHESLEECVVREVQEELGVTIAVEGQAYELTHEYPQWVVHLFAFRCRLVSGEPQAVECQTFQWVAPREFARYRFLPADQPLLGWLTSQGGR